MKMYTKRTPIKASKDYADLKGMDFTKARDLLTKDGFYEHEYGDKDNNNGYAVYRKGDQEVELQYRWIPGKRKGDAHAGKVTNVYVDEDINSATKVRSRRAIKASKQASQEYIDDLLRRYDLDLNNYHGNVGDHLAGFSFIEDRYGNWDFSDNNGYAAKVNSDGIILQSTKRLQASRSIKASTAPKRYEVAIDRGENEPLLVKFFDNKDDALEYADSVYDRGFSVRIADNETGESEELGEFESYWNTMTDVESAKKITCSYDADDIVMYFNGKKVFTGSVYDLTDTIEELCEDPVILEKFQEWCNEYGDPFDFDGTPRDTAATFVAFIEDEMDYYDGDSDHTFYASGQNGLDFEIFYADQEVGIPD